MTVRPLASLHLGAVGLVDSKRQEVGKSLLEFAVHTQR